MQDLYHDHIQAVVAATERALDDAAANGCHVEGVVFHAGSEILYHRDDHPIPFHSCAHFTRFAPLVGAGHLVHYRRGEGAVLYRYLPQDFWCEAEPLPDHPVADCWEIISYANEEELRDRLGPLDGHAVVGNDPAFAKRLDAVYEPIALVAALDWQRAFKTPYEIHCLRRAIDRVAGGFRAVRDAIESNASEHQLYRVFLDGCDAHPREVSFDPIVAWDEHASVLHYPRKTRHTPPHGNTLLLDAGLWYHGYGSDLTRTYVTKKAPQIFKDLVIGLDALQRRVVAAVGPEVSFIELHRMAERGICDLLHELGVLKLAGEEAHALGLSRPFFPHGLGHHLGLQVHDVGGHQLDASGKTQPPAEDCPFLRTTRPLAPGHVVTIEPGIYFIPFLLQEWREKHPDAFGDAELRELMPCGGVRIEDDVWVTEDGHEDLSEHAAPRA